MNRDKNKGRGSTNKSKRSPTKTQNKSKKKSTKATKSVKELKVSNKKAIKRSASSSNRTRNTRENSEKVVSIQPYLNERPQGSYKRITRPTQRSIKTVQREKKQRRLQSLSKIFTVVTFLLISAYITISTVKVVDNKPIEYETIEVGTLEKQAEISGILIRDETVYTAERNGIITYNVSQNERIRKSQFVAEIKDTVEIQQTEMELQEINEQILALQEKRDELSIFSKDIERLETQVQGIVESSIYSLVTGNIDNIYEAKELIDKNLNSRNQMLLSENTGSLETLSSQKFDIEEQINSNTQKIYSNDAGIVSYHTDGLEEILNFDSMNALTKEETLMLPKNTSEFRLDVLENEAVFKVVSDNTLYIASYIETDSISLWSEGNTRTIYINDSGTSYPLEVKIEALQRGTYETYVLMSTNKDMINFIDARNISFQVTAPKEGFKVALSAIVQENLIKIPNEYFSQDGSVIKKTEAGNLLVPIDIAGEDELFKFANINSQILDIGDIIVNAETGKEYQINEIQIVKGIYIVNAGVSSLREIDTDGAVQDDQFIILDTSKNTNIKLYDRYLKYS